MVTGGLRYSVTQITEYYEYLLETTDDYEYLLELLKCFKYRETPGNDNLNKELFKSDPQKTQVLFFVISVICVDTRE
jgi:hypothetical protein